MKKVLVGGCFDFIHYGHIVFLTEAKKLGDHLIVLLESDENVRKTKGKARPIHSQIQRKAMLETLTMIHEVIALPPMHSDQEYFAVVDAIKPAVIAVTDGDPIIEKKKQQAQMTGAKLIIIPKIHTPSTSQLAKLLGLE